MYYRIQNGVSLSTVQERDKFSVLIFDERVHVLFGLLKMTCVNKSTAKKLIEDIKVGTSTNLCAGLLKGMAFMI